MNRWQQIFDAGTRQGNAPNLSPSPLVRIARMGLDMMRGSRRGPSRATTAVVAREIGEGIGDGQQHVAPSSRRKGSTRVRVQAA